MIPLLLLLAAPLPSAPQDHLPALIERARVQIIEGRYGDLEGPKARHLLTMLADLEARAPAGSVWKLSAYHPNEGGGGPHSMGGGWAARHAGWLTPDHGKPNAGQREACTDTVAVSTRRRGLLGQWFLVANEAQPLKQARDTGGGVGWQELDLCQRWVGDARKFRNRQERVWRLP